MLVRNVRSALLTGGAVVGLMLASAAPAAAQSSEVEVLRGQVKDLLARIEKLEKTPAAAPSVAPTPMIKPANTKIDVTFGGWINRAMLYADNGAQDDIMFVDNTGAASRFWVTAQGKVNDTLTMGSVLEMQVSSNNTGTTAIGSADGSFSATGRKAEVWMQAKGLGRVWLGQGDMATKAITEQDLSGTVYLGNYADMTQSYGGLQFARRTGTAAAAPTVGQAFPNLVGGNRKNRVRFDTESFNGFTVSAGAAHDGNADVALRYAGKFGDTQVAAAVGYYDFSNTGSATVSSHTSGSVSVLLANGFNMTGAIGSTDFKGTRATNPDGFFWYAKLGYRANFSPVGRTNFVIDYYSDEDTWQRGSESVAYGFTVLQELTAINSEVYLNVRNHETEVVNGAARTTYDDVLGIMIGARVRF